MPVRLKPIYLICVVSTALTACGRKTPTVTETGAAATAPVAATTLATDPNEIAQAAAEVVRQTSQARDAVAARRVTAAIDHVDTALHAAAKLAGRATAPVYAETDEISLLGPIAAAAKAKPAASGGAARSEAPTTAPKSAKLKSAGKRPGKSPAIEAITGQYTRVLLDLNLARAHLTEARAALIQNDFARADAELAAVARGLLVESVAANLPLLRTSEDLALARQALTEGSDPAPPLAAAADGLRRYASAASVKHAAEAKSLAADMATAASSGSGPVKVAQVETWWTTVTQWLEEPA